MRKLWRIKVADAGVHRAVILHDGAAPKLLSQRDILAFAVQQIHTLPSALVDSSLEALNMVTPRERNVRGLMISGQLVQASAEDNLLSCLRRMALEDVIALPIVDEAGKLVANLSASDLRGVTADSLAAVILQPAIDFVRSPGRPVIVAQKSSRFGEVLQLLNNNHIHRVWIVDEQGKPVGVVSLSDILSKLWQSYD